MTDFDSIWRTQDEIRTVVNAVLGECIWNLAYEERRSAIVLQLTVSLEEDTISDLCCQFPIPASTTESTANESVSFKVFPVLLPQLSINAAAIINNVSFFI